jgi:hypothetical protein
MGVIKATCDFVQGTYGWSEIYFLNQTSTDLNAAKDTVYALMNKRAAMLGKQGIITGFTVSEEGVAGDAFPYYSSRDPWTGSDTYDSADQDLALIIRMMDPTYKRHRNMFIRGFFDDIEVRGGVFQRTDDEAQQKAYDAWISAYNKWVSILINKDATWGWPSVDATLTTQKGIVSVTPGTDDVITIVTQAGLWNPDELNKKQRVRLQNMTGAKNLNGLWVCIPSDDHTFKLTKLVPTFDWKGPSTAQVSRTSYKKINYFQIVRVTERKAGRPKHQHPGRRRARVLT